MQGDFTFQSDDVGACPGSRRFNVAASATTIKEGEPVAISALGDTVVIPMATNLPGVSGLVVGIATGISTNTAAAAGHVDVIVTRSSQTWLVRPKVAATFDTQAEYDNLVGKRVLADLTGGTYTLLAADGANNGLVVVPLDVAAHPGFVAVSFRTSSSFLA